MFRSIVIFVFLAPTLISSQDVAFGAEGNDFQRAILKALQTRRGLYSLRFGDADFGYAEHNGPETWGVTYPECLGPYQSPVSIKSENLEARVLWRPLKWSNLYQTPTHMSLEKSDISLGMSAMWKSKWYIPNISGGPLTEKYYFKQLHFHWNTSSNEGSEHIVNNRRYPMELHVVYATNMEGPPTEKDRILVTAFMITVTDVENLGFSRLIEAASKLNVKKGHHIPVTPFPLKALELDFCDDYVIYRGSLTTPPCTSGITWIISSRPKHFSLSQYNTLMELVSVRGQEYSANSRPVQSLNGRKLYYVSAPVCLLQGSRKKIL